MLKRTGQREDFTAFYAKWTAWPYFPKTQFYRIAGMSLPFAFTEHDLFDPSPGTPLGWQHVTGIVVSGTCLIGLAFGPLSNPVGHPGAVRLLLGTAHAPCDIPPFP